jgi:glycosyltransferase involved in cell wall biosynthesis
MRCPTIKELPAPPPGKISWPWTEESHRLDHTPSDGQTWPLISIVTPSYNQGQFIEETIRSVLLQGYPRLEYLIMDGGSVDQTINIIKQYGMFLGHWETGKDQGQSDALKKGFALATGDLLGWINSDDLLAPNAIGLIAKHWLDNNKPTVVTGQVVHLLDGKMDGEKIISKPKFNFDSLIRPWRLSPHQFQQLGSFFSRSAYDQSHGIDPSFHSAMDYDLYVRMLALDNRIVHISKILAYFRYHALSKTTGKSSTEIYHLKEHLRLMLPFLKTFNKSERKKLDNFYAEWSWHLNFKSMLMHRWKDSRQLARFALGFGCTTSFKALYNVLKRALQKTARGEPIEMIKEYNRCKQKD